MNIKVHITGFAIAYEPNRHSVTKSELPGRYQGSLYNQQKHAIADAVEWMRLNAVHKPRIFVCTSPGFVDCNESLAIQSFTTNLRNNYSMTHYVWVREKTKNGMPHWHFIADIPQFDPIAISLYWSSFFGSDAKNSIRLGTKPDKAGKRHYWIENDRMAWYMSKYIGKGFGLDRGKSWKLATRMPCRSFQISQEASERSKPVVYEAQIKSLYTGRNERIWVSEDFESIERGAPGQISAKSFKWKWTGHGETYIGIRRK